VTASATNTFSAHSVPGDGAVTITYNTGADICTPTTLTTKLSGNDVAPGTAVTDSAHLTGHSAGMAGGTVTYAVYSDSACQDPVGGATNTVTVHNGVVPNSKPETLPSGVYYWQASYSGDPRNMTSQSSCQSEQEIVKFSTTIVTLLSSSDVDPGTLVTDQAFVSTSSPITGGTVTYTAYQFTDTNCTGAGYAAGKVNVTNGAVPSSPPIAVLAGRYYWRASYSGDSYNLSSKSVCGSELEDARGPTQITVKPSSGTIAVGQSASATATLDGVTLTEPGLDGRDISIFEATRTVTYTIYQNNNCTGTFATKTVTLHGSVPSSGEVPFFSPGTFWWVATYNGDNRYKPSISACNAAPLQVGSFLP
jgi:hypothetical protein